MAAFQVRRYQLGPLHCTALSKGRALLLCYGSAAAANAPHKEDNLAPPTVDELVGLVLVAGARDKYFYVCDGLPPARRT